MEHHRVTITSSFISCGVIELYNMTQEVNDILFSVATNLYHPAKGSPAAFAMFSDVDKDVRTGHLLMSTVLHNNFGSVTESQAAINPKTGNVIKVYIWLIDHDNLKKWYVNERIKRLKQM